MCSFTSYRCEVRFSVHTRWRELVRFVVHTPVCSVVHSKSTIPTVIIMQYLTNDPSPVFSVLDFMPMKGTTVYVLPVRYTVVGTVGYTFVPKPGSIRQSQMKKAHIPCSKLHPDMQLCRLGGEARWLGASVAVCLWSPAPSLFPVL